MNDANSGPANRREFFRGGARYALLTALGAVSAVLVRRSGGKLSGQVCTNQGVCSSCTVYSGCGLPQALSRKRIQSSSSRRESAQFGSCITQHASRGSPEQSLLTSAATDGKEKA